MNHEHTFVDMSGRTVTLAPDEDNDTEYNVVMTTVVLRPGDPGTAVFKHYIVRREM